MHIQINHQHLSDCRLSYTVFQHYPSGTFNMMIKLSILSSCVSNININSIHINHFVAIFGVDNPINVRQLNSIPLEDVIHPLNKKKDDEKDQ